MAKLDGLFMHMMKKDASDLHIASGSAPFIRINGDLFQIDMKPLTHEQNFQMFNELMDDRNREELERKHQVDFVYAMGDKARFRANVFLQRRGVSAVFRIIPSKILSAEDLNLPAPIIKLCGLKKGLVLVTGPTGSGKSTTLAAMVDHINRTRQDHILTIEDPIEFVHRNKKCLVTQRQIGDNVDTFADSLRAALREDPDIILVGEMRDLETISQAITAAETGHLVFGTLHTTSAPKTVDRVIDAFPTTQQEQIRTMLAESLKGVIAQALLKRADRKGRIAAYEILLGTPALGALIRENKTFQLPSLIQTQRAIGMCLMDQALVDLVKQSLVEPDEAIVYAQDQKMFQAAVDRLKAGKTGEQADQTVAPPPDGFGF
ncbi:MAG: type IV pilus twitching motility protein PilT [Deltaproteobacteria bacterium]|nr:type IV pilus twitching motility protein PilT [Deltaproteobacteria bacterium]